MRGAILEAAERVFSVEGEAGLSIRRLAEEIDYSPSAIYKYFGSKDELVDELKEQLADAGVLIAPVGPANAQSLLEVRRAPGGGFEEQVLAPVVFVPLLSGVVD